jgi:phosphoesterase RecJ-like protein
MCYLDTLELFREFLKQLKGKRVVVLGHVRPDGDCIGSQVAMTRILRQSGVDAVALNAHNPPRNCQSFIGDTPFYSPDTYDGDERVIISVDCAAMDRFGKDLIHLQKDVFATIDHHISNPGYACYNFVHPQACATGEVLAEYCFALDIPIDPVTAQALYVGIFTDTGQFSHNVTERVFEVCGRLIAMGADPKAAADELYSHESRAKLTLLGRFLNSLEFHCGGKLCIGHIGDEDWEATGAVHEDTEGFVDYARDIEGVEIGVFLEQHGDQSKGSLRSKEPEHRVDQLAALFNGGGHACAAGFNPHEPIDSFYPRFLETIKNHFES